MARRGAFHCAVVCLSIAMVPLAFAEKPKTEEPGKFKAVLWIGGFAHDFETIAEIIVEELPKQLPIEIEVVRDGQFLDSPDVGNLDVILMNHCHKSAEGVLTEGQKGKLLELVRDGTGVVALHASYYSFLEWDEVHELYGTRFTKHGAVDIYLNVSITDKNHSITRDLADTFQTHSELYQSEPLADDCRVLAMAREVDTEQEYPSVWTRKYGKGRVVTILPAHWPDAYREEPFEKLIAAGARWAAGGNISHKESP